MGLPPGVSIATPVVLFDDGWDQKFDGSVMRYHRHSIFLLTRAEQEGIRLLGIKNNPKKIEN
jgi:hypothetical protein